MANVRRYTEDEVALALQVAGGVRKDAAKILGCHRRTLWNYVNRYPALKEQVEELDEQLVDLAEDALIRIVKDRYARGHLTAVMFTLKCKGKKRGWVPYNIVEHTGSIDQKHSVDLSGLDGDKLDALVEAALNDTAMQLSSSAAVVEPAEAK